MSAASIGKNLGRIHSEGTKALIRAAALNQASCIGIEVTDLELNTKTVYPSISEAARALNISEIQSSISQYFTKNQKKPCKGRYVFIAPFPRRAPAAGGGGMGAIQKTN